MKKKPFLVIFSQLFHRQRWCGGTKVPLALMLAVALLSGACKDFTVFTAKDFVVLEDTEPYDFRATTPEGLVIGVREFDNSSQHGELKFWTTAIENKLRLDQGYALEKTTAVTTLQGQEGVQMRFGLDRDDVAHLYIVTVFATDDAVFVLEAGGTEALVKKHQAQIDWSVSEFLIH